MNAEKNIKYPKGMLQFWT